MTRAAAGPDGPAAARKDARMHSLDAHRILDWPKLWALATFVSGCTATPLPEPPAFGPDLSRIAPVDRGQARPASEGLFSIVFHGQTGSADPGSTVRVTNLDALTPTVATSVAEDGSFAISLEVRAGDELRFESVRDGTRSPPSDARVREDYGLETAPRFDCIRLQSGSTIDFGTTPVAATTERSWVFRNACGSEIRVADPRWRLGTSGFDTAFRAAPVQAGDEFELPLTFTPTQAGGAEDVFFVEIEVAGERIRYPITAFGQAR